MRHNTRARRQLFQHGTSQASYGHPRCYLNLALLSCLLRCWFLNAFPISLIHATINLHPRSCDVLYKVPGSCLTIPQPPVGCQTPDDALPLSPSIPSPYPPAPLFRVYRSPNLTLLGNLWPSTWSSPTDDNNLLVRMVASMLSHPVRWRASL